jgi:hypothetical protein
LISCPTIIYKHAFEFCPSLPFICPPNWVRAIWSCRPRLDDRDADLDARQR